MNAASPSNPAQSPQDDTRALLERLVISVETMRRPRRTALITALVLSFATLTSTWCGYQATRWGDIASSSQAAADTTERKGAENTLAGLQLRTQDGLVILEYWRAVRQKDEKTAETLFLHMRPELQAALKASLDAGILTDPTVAGPLTRPEYQLAVETAARAQREEAASLRAEAQTSGRIASEYILLTVMLASVFFFGAVASTFSQTWIRRGMTVITLLLFSAVLVRVVILPVQRPLAAIQSGTPDSTPAPPSQPAP